MRNLTRHHLTRRTLLGGLAATALGSRASVPPPKDELLIGQSAPLSGSMANPMAHVLAGQQLAIDEINRKGGIVGAVCAWTCWTTALTPGGRLKIHALWSSSAARCRCLARWARARRWPCCPISPKSGFPADCRVQRQPRAAGAAQRVFLHHPGRL